MSYSVLELPAETHSMAREHLMSSAAFHLGRVIPAIADNADIDYIAIGDITSMSEAMIRGNIIRAATALSRIACDTSLRTAAQTPSAAELSMPIMRVTCCGLAAMDAGGDGADIVKMVAQTLLKLVETIDRRFSKDGLHEDFSYAWKELGARIYQIIDGGLVKLAPEHTEKLTAELKTRWPEWHAKLPPADQRTPHQS